jgi:hypothetical protein
MTPAARSAEPARKGRASKSGSSAGEVPAGDATRSPCEVGSVEDGADGGRSGAGTVVDAGVGAGTVGGAGGVDEGAASRPMELAGIVKTHPGRIRFGSMK